MSTVAIVGSRRRLDRQKVYDLVDSLPEDTTIVSGGCRGVDSWAIERAESRGLETIVHLPKLPSNDSQYHEFVQAYYARNELIVRDAIDGIFAFVSVDRTGGTENTIQAAQKLGRTIIIM